MDTRAFLEALWPASGIYCLATPYTIPNTDKQVYSHHTFTSIDAALEGAKRLGDTNIFFAMHTLKEHKRWNEFKVNWKTGEPGAWEVRPHESVSEARCFFFDLDVGESTPTTPKYATRQEALNALEAFLFRTRLPTPLITSSGGEFHVYWTISTPIGSLEWRRHAAVLHHLSRRLGLRVDPSRTTDQSSVLRVVGTFNVKPGHDPRPCVAVQAGRRRLQRRFWGSLKASRIGCNPRGRAVSAPPHRQRQPPPRLDRPGAHARRGR